MSLLENTAEQRLRQLANDVEAVCHEVQSSVSVFRADEWISRRQEAARVLGELAYIARSCLRKCGDCQQPARIWDASEGLGYCSNCSLVQLNRLTADSCALMEKADALMKKADAFRTLVRKASID